MTRRTPHFSTKEFMSFQITCKKTFLLLGALFITGCNNAADNKKSTGPAPVLISTTQVKVIDLDIVEQTVGTLEGIIDPKIGAEVAGRVVKVMAGAGMRIKRVTPGGGACAS